MHGLTESILIVEDTKEIRELIIMMFEEMECVECLVAENGKQALEILQEFPIHVIVTDIKMPEVNGVELCKEVREHGFEGPIVVITGDASSKDHRQLSQLHIEKIYYKPIDLDELKIHLRNLLHNEILKIAEKEALDILSHKIGFKGSYTELSTSNKVKLLLPLLEKEGKAG